MSESRRLPSSRVSRLSKLGQLAGGVVGGALSEGARQLARGKRPSLPDMLMTPGNFQRVADRLAEMRGAAMKVGQLISMEGGDFIPPELSELLARLRQGAYSMPLGQVAEVLERNWGSDWEKSFKQFKFTPLASASIGQVHQARLKVGARLAIKIQYPGVRESIDSDVDNVSRLLKVLNMVPEHLDLDSLLEEAKLQLHQEADYQQEAAYLQKFSDLLADDSGFRVPHVYSSRTTDEVLCMEYLEGQPIESLMQASAEARNEAAEKLLRLAFRELLDWGLVQTDPNFANYQVDHETGAILLFDFGASRHYDEERRQAFLRLIKATVDGDSSRMAAAATDVGYLGHNDPEGYRDLILDLVSAACVPLMSEQPYDFSDSGLANRMAEITVELRTRQNYGQLPPPDVLFLHRKLGGLFFLFTRLRAQVDVAEIIEPYLDGYF